MSTAAARAAEASAVSSNARVATRSTPKRAISSEPGVANTANMTSGMPTSRPTCV
jgi:hypothetical protein